MVSRELVGSSPKRFGIDRRDAEKTALDVKGACGLLRLAISIRLSVPSLSRASLLLTHEYCLSNGKSENSLKMVVVILRCFSDN